MGKEIQSLGDRVMGYTGIVVEMGDLIDMDGPRGLLIEIRSNLFISITGFARSDITAMPNLLYKNVKITIEEIDETAHI